MNKFLHNSAQYTCYRPEYPLELFQYLRSLIDADDDLVLDCGVGSGQAVQGLSLYFNQIIATDLSRDLLLNAPSLSNVYYVQAAAEQIPIRSDSVGLICVAQALHWFSLNEFYAESKRILHQHGIIAAWCYNQAFINPHIDNVIKKLYVEMLGSQNFSFARQYVYEHYQTIPFPFTRIVTPKFKIEMKWNLSQLLGYMSTWPGLLEYQKNLGINLLDKIHNDLLNAWENPNELKCITWPVYLLLGRKV